MTTGKKPKKPSAKESAPAKSSAPKKASPAPKTKAPAAASPKKAAARPAPEPDLDDDLDDLGLDALDEEPVLAKAKAGAKAKPGIKAKAVAPLADDIDEENLGDFDADEEEDLGDLDDEEDEPVVPKAAKGAVPKGKAPKKIVADDDDEEESDDEDEDDEEGEARPAAAATAAKPKAAPAKRPVEEVDAPAVVPARRLTPEAKAKLNELLAKGVNLNEALKQAAQWETFVAPVREAAPMADRMRPAPRQSYPRGESGGGGGGSGGGIDAEESPGFSDEESSGGGGDSAD